MNRRLLLICVAAVVLLGIGPAPRYLEELRIGGGFGSTPDGGIDLDKQGNIFADGDLTLGGNLIGDVRITGGVAIDGVDANWTVYLAAAEGLPALSGGSSQPGIAAWSANKIETPVLAFDPSVDEYAAFSARMPAAYDGRALEFTLDWGAMSGSSGNVVWTVSSYCIAPGGDLGDSTVNSVEFSPSAFTGARELHSPAAAHTPLNASGGGLLTVVVRRNAAHASDTLGVDALLIGVRVRYAG